MNAEKAGESSVFLPYSESLMSEWESYVTSLAHMPECVTARRRRKEIGYAIASSVADTMNEAPVPHRVSLLQEPLNTSLYTPMRKDAATSSSNRGCAKRWIMQK
ncbi:hypothetical protein DPX16_15588 [Anabarilius grahami]|uniref:Uncharacterized protein n=1 Tax=Anabarilius grahami TaxID=495550 RepID=A0A3N0Z691_ANAGA|nr:hypothetical protein DPX16_15588 [Anabarilius grahami]